MSSEQVSIVLLHCSRAVTDSLRAKKVIFENFTNILIKMVWFQKLVYETFKGSFLRNIAL